jgi:GT2 family glycosyltransferase
LKEGSFKDFELIVVDNGSSDGSQDFIRKYYPDVLLIELGANLGLAVASNRGRQAARGEYLFFYNNDTVADRRMLQELVKTMESNPRVGITGCKTLTYDAKREINSGVELDIFGYPYGRGRPFYVDAAIFIRSRVFDEIGGFDPRLFLYCEDRDLCWRLQLYGYDLVVSENAKFRHDSFCAIDEHGRLTTNIKKRFMGEAFTLRMLLKNYSFLTLLWILPAYLLINIAEIVFFLLTFKWKVIFCVYLKAYLWNLAYLADTLGLRARIQRQRKISDNIIQSRMYKGSGKFQLFKKVGVPKFAG